MHELIGKEERRREVGIYFISMVMAENACEACASLNTLPQKSEYRNCALDHIKTAIQEAEEAHQSGVLKDKESQLLFHDFNILVQGCRECSGTDMAIHHWIRKMVVLAEAPEDGKIHESSDSTVEATRGSGLN